MISERKDIDADRIFYQKSGGKNYLVICSGEESELPYQINMIRYNNITGLLPVQFFIEDGEYRYFYDISCKESLSERMKQKKYSIKEIRTVMSDLYRCVQQLDEYLLDSDCLILEPEYLFTEKDSLHIQFCFYPDKKESFEKSLEKLFDYFLNQLDYQDEKTVVLVYSIYQKSREENVPLYELMQQFCDRSVSGKSEEQSDTVYQKNADQYVNKSENETGQNMNRQEKKRIFPQISERESNGICPNNFEKFQGRKIIPYVPDLIGGYGIARILWYLSRNYTHMGEKSFMFWVMAMAFILIACGSLSALLSGILDKKDVPKEETILADKNPPQYDGTDKEIHREKQSEKQFSEKQEESQQTIQLKGKRKEKKQEKFIENDEKGDEKRFDGRFEEFSFEEQPEIQYENSRNVIPATVVMNESELFRAFNPVLVSKKKEVFPDILIKDRMMVIGKIRGIADICLEGRSISRVHARIVQDESGCGITDLGSTNGTFINGVRLGERQTKYLQQGDEVRFAEAVFEFQTKENQILRSQQMPDAI